VSQLAGVVHGACSPQIWNVENGFSHMVTIDTADPDTGVAAVTALAFLAAPEGLITIVGSAHGNVMVRARGCCESHVAHHTSSCGARPCWCYAPRRCLTQETANRGPCVADSRDQVETASASPVRNW